MSQRPEEMTGVDREELRLLYSVSVSDIAGFKQQQWSVASYALAIYAAVVAVSQLLNQPLITAERWFLLVIIGTTASAGLGILFNLRRSIEERRERLRRVRRQFGKAFNDAWSVQKRPDHVHWFLALAMVLGAVIACWLLFSHE